MISLVVGLVLAQSAVPREIGAIRFLVGDWTGSVSGANVSLGVTQGPGGRSLKFSLRVTGSLIEVEASAVGSNAAGVGPESEVVEGTVQASGAASRAA